MFHRSALLVGVFILLSLCICIECRAGDPEHGKTRQAVQLDRLKRAGNPHAIAWYARPSVTKRYAPYYIGGGAAIKGEHRHPEEGTWGLDYVGALFKRRVKLGWWHGRREQDGGGSYKTDGPHVLGH